MRLPTSLFAVAAVFAVHIGANAARAGSWFESIDVVEVKGGVLVHDFNRDQNESKSIDVNAEIVIRGDDLFEFENDSLNFIFNPRVNFGAAVNTRGKTHRAYAGFDWQYLFESRFFAGGSVGAVGHTGNLHQKTRACAPGEGCGLPGNRAFVETGDPSLGSRVLIRAAMEFGYSFESGVSVSVFGAHMSNAGLASDNDGMDFVGARLGYALGPRRR